MQELSISGIGRSPCASNARRPPKTASIINHRESGLAMRRIKFPSEAGWVRERDPVYTFSPIALLASMMLEHRIAALITPSCDDRPDCVLSRDCSSIAKNGYGEGRGGDATHITVERVRLESAERASCCAWQAFDATRGRGRFSLTVTESHH